MDQTVSVKYPLPCGCAGPKYISMCAAHQELARQEHARKLGHGLPHCPTCACVPVPTKRV